MEEKKFVGLDGLKYFWTKIEAKVIKIIEDEIAQIIAKAPEDLDTLKEIADWISTHEDSASAMNTAILANTEAISGKADKSHTHTKSQITDFPTSLPANGGTATKATQDGSGNVITSTYVKKSGDTLTGPIVMKANQYTLETAQLDMKNSDIKGANAIWFDDHAEVGEGLKFPRSSGSNYDFMRLDDGKIKVAPNVTGNANTATESIVAYTSDIPTSLPANGGTAATILDYISGTPIKVRWGGPGIDSAEWYPAFNADGSALEPINKANIRAGKSDLTTGIEYTGESDGCISAQQTAESFNNSSGGEWASYIICNHGNGKTYYHQMLRLPFFSDTIQLQRRVNGELKGWKNVAIIENENTWSGRQSFDTAKVSNKMVIPIGEPSSLEDGCIWIER